MAEDDDTQIQIDEKQNERIEKLKKDLNENAVFTTPEEYEGIKQELSKLKEQVTYNKIMATAKAIIVPKDKAILWTSQIDIQKKEISELEKKLSDYYERIDNRFINIETIIGLNHQSEVANIKPFKERIEKLEKVHKHNFHISAGELIAYRKIQKELSELKNQIHNNAVSDLNHYDELKERVEGIFKSIHGISPDEPDIIKEVLREFQMIAETSIDFKTFSAMSKTLKSKLDGEKSVANTIRKSRGISLNSGGISTVSTPSEPKSLIPTISEFREKLKILHDYTFASCDSPQEQINWIRHLIENEIRDLEKRVN